jgi:uncharacterized membrane protein HdeD (DUF308 family)
MFGKHELKELRWSLALRGLAAVIFGALAVMWPGITLLALLVIFGVYALVDGLALLIGSLANLKILRDWWLVPIVGAFSVLIGVLTFARPGMTAMALLWLIAARAVFTGIVEIVYAIQHWTSVRGEWLLVLGGLFSLVFGILVFAYPLEGALAVVWLIGVYAVLFGLTQMAFAGYARLWELPVDQGLPHPPAVA